MIVLEDDFEKAIERGLDGINGKDRGLIKCMIEDLHEGIGGMGKAGAQEVIAQVGLTIALQDRKREHRARYAVKLGDLQFKEMGRVGALRLVQIQEVKNG